MKIKTLSMRGAVVSVEEVNDAQPYTIQDSAYTYAVHDGSVYCVETGLLVANLADIDKMNISELDAMLRESLEQLGNVAELPAQFKAQTLFSRYGERFRSIFNFYPPVDFIGGLDIVRLDRLLNVGQQQSTAAHIRAEYGEQAVVLVREMLHFRFWPPQREAS